MYTWYLPAGVDRAARLRNDPKVESETCRDINTTPSTILRGSHFLLVSILASNECVTWFRTFFFAKGRKLYCWGGTVNRSRLILFNRTIQRCRHQNRKTEVFFFTDLIITPFAGYIALPTDSPNTSGRFARGARDVSLVGETPTCTVSYRHCRGARINHLKTTSMHEYRVHPPSSRSGTFLIGARFALSKWVDLLASRHVFLTRRIGFAEIDLLCSIVASIHIL